MDGDAPACLGQIERDGAADAARRAGDQYRFSCRSDFGSWDLVVGLRSYRRCVHPKRAELTMPHLRATPLPCPGFYQMLLLRLSLGVNSCSFQSQIRKIEASYPGNVARR